MWEGGESPLRPVGPSFAMIRRWRTWACDHLFQNRIDVQVADLQRRVEGRQNTDQGCSFSLSPATACSIGLRTAIPISEKSLPHITARIWPRLLMSRA